MANVHSFKTSDGTEWHMLATIPVARRVRAQHGIDLLAVTAPIDDNPLMKLAADPYLLADVLWTILGEQAARHGIEKDRFEELIFEAIDDAVNALVEAALDNYPQKKREALLRLWRAQEAAIDEVVRRIESQSVESIATAAVESVFGSDGENKPQSIPGN